MILTANDLRKYARQAIAYRAMENGRAPQNRKGRITKRIAQDFIARSEGFEDWGAMVRAVQVPVLERGE
jgi:hypothetical protein